MLEKIIFSIIALVLFIYIFMYKVIKKNDTTYFIIILLEATGILINFIQIIFGVLLNSFFQSLMYILAIILPFAIALLELGQWNFTESLYVLTSKILLLLKRDEQARKTVVALINKNNESYKAHLLLAKIYEKSNVVKRAIDEYVKCIDINKNDYNSYFRIAELLNISNKKEQSMEMLKNLLSKKTEYYKARELLANILMEKQEFKKSIDNYILALKYDSNNWEIYYNLGIAYSKINDFTNAKNCFEKSTEINEDLYQSYYALAQIALLYRDIQIAEIYFTKSSYEQYEGMASFELAKIYMIKNDRNKAIIFLNKAIEINSEYYKKAKEEPMFLVLKSNIKPPKDDQIKYVDTRTKKEKEIEKYLSDTYILTKALEKDNKKQNANKKFKW